jgi:hypothetical protein
VRGPDRALVAAPQHVAAEFQRVVRRRAHAIQGLSTHPSLPRRYAVQGSISVMPHRNWGMVNNGETFESLVSLSAKRAFSSTVAVAVSPPPTA